MGKQEALQHEVENPQLPEDPDYRATVIALLNGEDPPRPTVVPGPQERRTLYDCPVCKVDTSFEPIEMIGRLLRGEIDDVVEEGQAWKCVECFTCQELCHSDIGMAETFRKLKELAAAEGKGPDSVEAAYGEFRNSGMLGKPRESARKKLGLEPLPESGGESLARVLAGDEGEESS